MNKPKLHHHGGKFCPACALELTLLAGEVLISRGCPKEKVMAFVSRKESKNWLLRLLLLQAAAYGEMPIDGAILLFEEEDLGNSWLFESAGPEVSSQILELQGMGFSRAVRHLAGLAGGAQPEGHEVN